MSNEVDRYDVEAMIRDERHEIRAEMDRAVAGLRSDLHLAVEDLRVELGDVRAAIAAMSA